mmetsp:Transcript_88619/g.162684  ORF Transcript_88619/g.162684 Transcript_88619/m.162684 type:complete len:255 (-) Transcript_88619:249-1013(-)
MRAAKQHLLPDSSLSSWEAARFLTWSLVRCPRRAKSGMRAQVQPKWKFCCCVELASACGTGHTSPRSLSALTSMGAVSDVFCALLTASNTRSKRSIKTTDPSHRQGLLASTKLRAAPSVRNPIEEFTAAQAQVTAEGSERLASPRNLQPNSLMLFTAGSDADTSLGRGRDTCWGLAAAPVRLPTHSGATWGGESLPPISSHNAAKTSLRWAPPSLTCTQPRTTGHRPYKFFILFADVLLPLANSLKTTIARLGA